MPKRDIGIEIKGDFEKEIRRRLPEHYQEAVKTIEELRIALDASVKLQSHYARLLNMFDGGERRTFKDGHEWAFIYLTHKEIKMDDNRPFPIQYEYKRNKAREMERHEPCEIPWWLAEVAYEWYAERYGKQQSLERLAERGGFGRDELIGLIRREL